MRLKDNATQKKRFLKCPECGKYTRYKNEDPDWATDLIGNAPYGFVEHLGSYPDAAKSAIDKIKGRGTTPCAHCGNRKKLKKVFLNVQLNNEGKEESAVDENGNTIPIVVGGNKY